MIEAYGDGGFTIGGVRSSGSILVFPGRVEAFSASEFNEITLDSLAEVFRQDPAIELLLVGCGAVQGLPSGALRQGLSKAGVVADFMNTGAACRTFNVLLAEDRRVAAALIAVD
jgi:uncharacterized protein